MLEVHKSEHKSDAQRHSQNSGLFDAGDSAPERFRERLLIQLRALHICQAILTSCR